MRDYCLVSVREVRPTNGPVDVELSAYPTVPQAEIKQAAQQMLATENAGHVLVMRSVVPLGELLAWFRAHRPIKEHPELVGIIQRSGR